MKLKELFSSTKISEHIKNARLDPVSIETQKDWLSLANLADQALQIPGRHLLMYLYKASAAQHIFVLVDRKNQHHPLGYAWLQKEGIYWMVGDVEIAQELRGQGIATNFYRSLHALGYKLISGNILSAQAERVWISLGKNNYAKVLNKKTGSIEKFSDKPMKDVSVHPDFVWVLECPAYEAPMSILWESRADHLREWFAGKETVYTVGIHALCIDAFE